MALEDLDLKELLKNNLQYIVLLIIFFIAYWIRAIPASSMQYLQALDPYMISRMSFNIAKNGFMPQVDFLRYFPYFTPTYMLNLGNIYIPAFLFKITNAISGIDFLTFAKYYPAAVGALMAVAMYFIGEESFDKYTGLASGFFLATSAAILHRSSAGWFEKEAIAGLLMLVSVYFFIRAWKRESWLSGIIGGTALGISAISWGGTSFLFLLYPLTAFIVLLLNEDVEKLLVSYTPLILLGTGLAVILNPSKNQLMSATTLFSLAPLIFIWLRYLVEEFDAIKEKYLPYFTPGAYLTGGIVLLLSPLYSQTLASQIQKVMSKMLQTGSDMPALYTTVAENTPATSGQILTKLGAGFSSRVLPGPLTAFSEFFSAWTFAIIGSSIIFSVMLVMLFKKFSIIEEATKNVLYGSIVLALIVTVTSVSFLMSGFPINAVLPATVILLLGALILYNARDSEVKVETKWYYILFVLWIFSTIYGVAQRSRLMFLTAMPVSLMAGYGLSKGLQEVKRSKLFENALSAVKTNFKPKYLFAILVIVMVAGAGIFNTAAAYVMANRVGGSPNQYWMENLEYMREETPIDSVILSWWDYGYWFETIGGRASIADGGNLGYYTQPGERKVNYPLADFLTASNYEEYLPWLQDRSIDYIVLDYSMIGKYSAVSKIHHRKEKVNAMQSFGFAGTTKMRNDTFLKYCELRSQNNCDPRFPEFFVPVKQVAQQIRVSGAPIMKTARGTSYLRNFCSTNGIDKYAVPEDSGKVPGCLAFDPLRGASSIIYIPEKPMKSTLVGLYIMEGQGMEHFQKVKNASNGYVKMWKVNY